jgi:NAD(P)H-dependent FMN reductase
MKIVIISGSSRGNREGKKVSKFVKRQAAAKSWEAVIIDPWELELPLLDKTFAEMKDPEQKFIDLHELFTEADGFILVSAEYNHSVPPALKNTLDHFRSEYFYKPSGIVSYSTGPFGGIRAGEHLRGICAELGMPSIPTMLPISKVKESLNEDGTSVEGVYERRSAKFFNEFEWYLEALKNQRAKGLPVS